MPEIVYESLVLWCISGSSIICSLSINELPHSVSFCRFCELCHYKFKFASSEIFEAILYCLQFSFSVYRHDMPRWLPFTDLYDSLFQGSTKKIQKWLHLGFVVFVWIGMVPVLVCKFIESVTFKILL